MTITRFILLLGLSMQALIAQNVLITTALEPNEPSLAIDPKHPNVLIAGANIETWHMSTDTGATWTTGKLWSTLGVWGDPVMAVDTAGSLYFFHLSRPLEAAFLDRIVCQKSEDMGKTWSDGSYTGKNGDKAQDKHWYAINRRNNHLYLTWTQFDQYESKAPSDSSIILFSRSTDAGLTWTPAKRINKYGGDCLDSDNTVEGAVPAIGPNGELYVSWAGPKGLTFNISTDEGETWLPQETIIRDIPGGWEFDVPGISRCNGLPVTLCDTSHGPHRGTLYINWSDQRNGETNTDVWLIRSTDQGRSWSEPVRVNTDNGHTHQFFTWMTIDQTTGYLYGVFYDRRNYPEGNATDVFIAVSTDGGATFTNHLISEKPFVPTKKIFFGDYTNIVAHDGIIRPIWTRMHNGNLSVWTHLCHHGAYSPGPLEKKALKAKFAFEKGHPKYQKFPFLIDNPTRPDAEAELYVKDERGLVVNTLWHKGVLPWGIHKYINLSEQDLRLLPGKYTLVFERDHTVVRTLPIVIHQK